MSSPAVILQNVSVTRQSQALLNDVSFELPEGSHLLITGLSGSGKTVLLEALAAKLFYRGNVIYNMDGKSIHPHMAMAGQHHYFKNRSSTSHFYYQQRFNSNEAADAETLTEALTKHLNNDITERDELIAAFGLAPLQQAPLLQLSSGEHKRFQMVKVLLSKPQLLLLDEPFMGLDAACRRYLKQLLDEKSAGGCTIVMITAVEDAPACITHIAELDKGQLIYFGKKEMYQPQIQKDSTAIFASFPAAPEPHFATVIAMQQVHIRYGEKTILNNINWQVTAGEKWLIRGGNGAGKSTLISLITGDNPQAFANQIVLFDRKKGSGESIWDIKKNIGYVSPELQWHFDTGTTCSQAVASGLFDTIGLFRKLSKLQEEAVHFWLQQFGLLTSAHQPLRSLPHSRQKLVLLARAMVKNPPMLILDEPCQGLDLQQKQQFLAIVDALCTHHRTLIYVSHYHSEVPACISQVLHLTCGEATITQTGASATPKQITEPIFL